ncbi:MAG: hypothetical protein SNI70_05990 [Rikenellaceae bacterium]
MILAHRITIFNHQIVDFLQNEYPQYQQRFIREVAPKQIDNLRDLMEKFDYPDIEFESVEKKINYAWEISDGINSATAALEGLLEILENIEGLIEDSSDLEHILDYQITFNDTLKDMGFKSSYFEIDEEEIDHNTDTFTWNGTPSELALLFFTLVDNGYIEPPLLTDGKVNKSGLSRKISTHFNLVKGSFKSVLNALGENTITPDNQFYIAMNKVPRNRKEA